MSSSPCFHHGIEIDRDEHTLTCGSSIMKQHSYVFILEPSNLGRGRDLLCLQHLTNFLHRGMRTSHRRCDLANGPAFEHKVHHRPVISHNRTPLAMPRALKSRGHQRVSPENSSVTRYSPSRYSILTTVLLNARAQHRGQTRPLQPEPVKIYWLFRFRGA